jgi:hypothetical protein
VQVVSTLGSQKIHITLHFFLFFAKREKKKKNAVVSEVRENPKKKIKQIILLDKSIIPLLQYKRAAIFRSPLFFSSFPFLFIFF